ncbi:MAG: sulfite exporter TauE/SafE family protein [Pseudomonadota bacterium]
METILANWPLIVGLAGAGLLAGLAAGLLGVGGGAVIVPALFLIFTELGYGDTAMHVATGTSLSTIILTSLRSVMAHHQRGAVDWAILKAWAPWIIVGAVAGRAVAGQLSANGLTMVFGAVAFLISLQFFFGRPNWRLFEDMATGPIRWGLGSAMGTLSSLMGIGAGTFGVTLMTVSGRPIHQAVGTAAGMGLAIGVPGAIAAVIEGWGRSGLPAGSLGHVNIVAFAFISILTVTMAPIGARFAHSLDAAKLRRVFAVLLAIVAARMIWSVISG